MNRLYCPELNGSPTKWRIDNPDAVHYLSRVLRLHPGDAIELFSANAVVAGTIGSFSQKAVTCVDLSPIAPTCESPLTTHIGLCLARSERMDYSMQKATELGVTSITPLQSAHSQMSCVWAHKKTPHWHGIAVHAAQQSGRTHVPDILPATKLEQWVEQVDAERKIVLFEQASASLETTPKPRCVALLIGPEGGLTQHEVDTARKQGFAAVRLGPRILRCESVAPAMLGIMQFLWGDMGSDHG